MTHSARDWPSRLGLLLAIGLAYANSFRNGFHFDDFHTIVDNPAIRSLRNVPRFFRDATTFSVLPANRTYRPMVSSSLALDYSLGHGYGPLWFHVGTFVLFLVLVLLLQTLYRGVMDAVFPHAANHWLAWLAAAWFGLHPAMAETVNYIIQRGDVYSTLGCVAALVIFARRPGLRKTGVYLLPLVFALLSKPPAAVFPALIFCYVYFFEATERRARTGWQAALPSAIIVTLLLWLQAAMTPKTFLASAVASSAYRWTQPFVWLRYVGELFLPLRLNVDSDLAPLRAADPRVIVGLVFAGLAGGAIWYTARHRRTYPIAFGLIWFVVTQLPTSLYPLSEVENDHRMFFSFPGLMLAVVWAAWLGIERLPVSARAVVSGPAGTVMLGLLLTAYGYGVPIRNRVWLNEETLWRDDVQKSPHNGRGWMIYGLTQMNRGEYAAALGNFTEALKYTPNYPTLEINLGIVTGAMADEIPPRGAATLAEAHFRRAIALAPGDDATHAFYGRWLRTHGRLLEARAQLQTAIALNPQRTLQREELIEAYVAQGDVAGALQAARQLLMVTPDDALAEQTLAHPPTGTAAFWINLSLAQYQAARYQESIASARHALLLNPQSAEAYNNIGAASAALHEWDAAIAADERAVALMPALQLAHNNLAWATAQKRAAAH